MLIPRTIRRRHVHDHHEVGRRFANCDAKPSDLVRQPCLNDGKAILNQNLGLVDIHAGLEHDIDGELPVAGGLGADVEHVVDAIDLLLDRGSHRFGDDLGRRAGYVALMLTVGGTISGYSEIGSDCCAIAPAIVKISASTVAKTGRSMKKWENRIDNPISDGRLFGCHYDVARYRGHNRPRANGSIRQTGNHHAVIPG